MNLEDVLDPEYGLQQDEWSLTKPTFGDEGQLQVIGWSGKNSSHKWYIVICNKCASDKELYGEGMFRASKGNLLKPSIPCGCSRRTKLSAQQYITIAQRFVKEDIRILEYLGSKANNAFFKLECTVCSADKELFPDGWQNYMSNIRKGCGVSCLCSDSPKLNYTQWNILCKRLAEDRGLKYLGLGAWISNNKTPVFVECSCGEPVKIISIDMFKNAPSDSYACKSCQSGRRSLQMKKQRNHTNIVQKIIEATRKSDDAMISSFLKSGGFNPDTKFWRSERKLNNQKGSSKVYWFMMCPDCGETGESPSSSLQKGSRSCVCNSQRQQECYINILADGSSAVAIKFGIANNSKQRAKQQNYTSVYEVKQYQVYKFPDVASCKKAERECKKELECGVVLKRDMPDGYSETTWAYNILKVKAIYERNGGILSDT